MHCRVDPALFMQYILFSLTVLRITCEHLHELYTLNSFSGWKGLTKFIHKGLLGLLKFHCMYNLFSLVIVYNLEKIIFPQILISHDGITSIFNIYLSWKKHAFFKWIASAKENKLYIQWTLNDLLVWLLSVPFSLWFKKMSKLILYFLRIRRKTV